MKTILVFVSTLDGKTTKWGNPMIRSWSSSSDQDYFDKLWNSTRVIIMGSGTYNPEPIKPDRKHLFIVMTRIPEKYKRFNMPGQLEFTDESPLRLLERFKDAQESTILIVGGAHVATSFLKMQMIDELWLTIEPKIFGMGDSLVITEKLDVELKLLSFSRANDRGTLFTKYAVIRDKEK